MCVVVTIVHLMCLICLICLHMCLIRLICLHIVQLQLACVRSVRDEHVATPRHTTTPCVVVAISVWIIQCHVIFDAMHCGFRGPRALEAAGNARGQLGLHAHSVCGCYNRVMPVMCATPQSVSNVCGRAIRVPWQGVLHPTIAGVFITFLMQSGI